MHRVEERQEVDLAQDYQLVSNQPFKQVVAASNPFPPYTDTNKPLDPRTRFQKVSNFSLCPVPLE